MKGLDPITVAVIQAGLQQVCNEMDIAFTRSAFSPVIAEADDRSSGIYDRNTKFRSDLSVAYHMVDEDEDGVWEVCKDHREDGTTTTWSDKDGDGIYDEATVTDRERRVLQTLVWQPGAGFVPKKP